MKTTLNTNIYTPSFAPSNNVGQLVAQLGTQTQMPNGYINYCVFNDKLVNQIVSQKENAVPPLVNFLKTAQYEPQIVEGLYTLDRLITSGAKNLQNVYPAISRFNTFQSPNIKVYLSGIYRKTQPPDAFGPLCRMLIQESLHPTPAYFDPIEEIGGAVLEYLKNNGAQDAYKGLFLTTLK